MNTFNAITTVVFDLILAPFGHGLAAFDLVLWSLLTGIVALVVYKYASNQKGIERAKDQIKMHLLEIRLWRNDIVVVFTSTLKILGKNAVYLGHNLSPMVILMVPFLAILCQLEANYAFDPAPVGSVELLTVELADDANLKATDVEVELPEGVVLDAPPVRTADGEVFYRLRAETAGDHVITLRAKDEVFTKGWAVGGAARKVPVMRTRTWDGFLYPGEEGIPSGSAFHHVAIAYPVRSLPYMPDGETGIIGVFLVLSLLAGVAFKDVLGVTF